MVVRLLRWLLAPPKGRSRALEAYLMDVTVFQEDWCSRVARRPSLGLGPVHLAREQWLAAKAKAKRDGWDVDHLHLPPIQLDDAVEQVEYAEALEEVDRLLAPTPPASLSRT